MGRSHTRAERLGVIQTKLGAENAARAGGGAKTQPAGLHCCRRL